MGGEVAATGLSERHEGSNDAAIVVDFGRGGDFINARQVGPSGAGHRTPAASGGRNSMRLCDGVGRSPESDILSSGRHTSVGSFLRGVAR